MVDEHCVIADHGVVVARDVVCERRHGVIANRHGVVPKPGIYATKRDLSSVGISPIILSSPLKCSLVVAVVTERTQSGTRVSLGGMASLASSMALSTERSIVVIVVLPSTTV